MHSACRLLCALFLIQALACCAAGSPCAHVAERHTAPFVSTCSETPHFVGAEVHLFVCFPPRDETAGDNASTGFDPVTRAHPPDAFSGRVSLRTNQTRVADNTNFEAWSSTYAINFHAAAWNSFRISSSARQFVCYAASVMVYDAGTYDVVVLHEYQNWDWDPAWDKTGGLFGRPAHGDLLSLPNTTEIFADSAFTVLDNNAESTAAELPLCTTNFHGRWVGREYVPGSCALRAVTYDEFDRCMATLGGDVLIYGDSHSRRAMKVLVSDGEWCAAKRESRECQCEDAGETTTFNHEFKQYGNVSLTFKWMMGTRSSDVLPLLETLRVRVLVVAGMTAWDAAGDDLSSYIVFLEGVVKALRRSPASVLIFRTTPAYCCTVDQHGERRYTSQRDMLFNLYFRRRMLVAFPDALWWDTRELTVNRPLNAIGQHAERCLSNHMASELVEQDVKTFMHHICHNVNKAI